MPSRISPLVLAILLVFTVAGCAKKTEEQTTDTTSSSSDTDSLTSSEDEQSELTDEQKAIQKLFLQAQKDTKEGRYEDALAQIEKARESAPDDEDVKLAAAVSIHHIAQNLSEAKSELANKLVLQAYDIAKTLDRENGPNRQIKQELLVRLMFEKAIITAENGKADESFDLLMELQDMGFQQFAMVEQIDSFAPVRELPEYAEFAKSLGLRGFPFDFALPSAMDDSTISLKQFRGKVVIVDIWGTWCGPCKMEVPHFVKLQEEYGDQGLQIVGINYEDLQDQIPDAKEREIIQRFADDYLINYPLVLGDEETQAKVPDFNGFPTTLFIDREGEVELKLVGAAPYSALESIVKKMLDDGKSTTEPKTSKPATKSDGPAVAEDAKS
ncbi:TlpA family protein disulfide reductase [Thalassoroseus pseudoceratinae]|uniref:TlpA family protein disulfide reductase n=1 Tax=Thalassoroseus pseudoceratinae TaxID=2713176 RepID=UPI0014223476|nr:TlpA disulfide reductase family protein [Thalassoroseus pseudoceratinae]